jgi:hypothetical protein
LLDDASGRKAFTEFHENPTEGVVADTGLKTEGQTDRQAGRQTQIGVVVTYAFSFPSERTPNKCQLLQMWLLVNSEHLFSRSLD